MNDPAVTAILNALTHTPVNKRLAFLHALLLHSSAALTVLSGTRETAEALYRLADDIATRGNHEAR